MLAMLVTAGMSHWQIYACTRCLDRATVTRCLDHATIHRGLLEPQLGRRWRASRSLWRSKFQTSPPHLHRDVDASHLHFPVHGHGQAQVAHTAKVVLEQLSNLYVRRPDSALLHAYILYLAKMPVGMGS